MRPESVPDMNPRTNAKTLRRPKKTRSSSSRHFCRRRPTTLPMLRSSKLKPDGSRIVWSQARLTRHQRGDRRDFSAVFSAFFRLFSLSAFFLRLCLFWLQVELIKDCARLHEFVVVATRNSIFLDAFSASSCQDNIFCKDISISYLIYFRKNTTWDRCHNRLIFAS